MLNQRLSRRKAVPLFSENRHKSRLPFVGRDVESEWIHTFCRQVFDGEGPSLLWITGEAGIGKSRLIEEARPTLEEERRIVIQAQFRPGALNSASGLIADVLHRHVHFLQKSSDPAERPDRFVIATLQQITRLRPTVLILEDLHLLDEAEALSLSNILRKLSDEPICLIFTARPTESPAYQILSPWIDSSLELPPLSREAICSILKDANQAFQEDHIQLVCKFSRGLPLLVNAVHSELLRLSSARIDLSSRLREQSELLKNTLSNDYLREFTAVECDALRKIALLGEVFSVEAATIIVPNAKALIQQGISSGLLGYSRTGRQPIWGKTLEEWPVAFAHTLLHEELIDRTALNPSELIQVLRSDAAIFSILPIQHIAETLPEQHFLGEDEENIVRIIETLCSKSFELIKSPDWNLGTLVLDAAEAYFVSRTSKLRKERIEEVEVLLLQQRLFSLRMEMYGERSMEVIQKYLERTRNAKTIQMAEHRCTALTWGIWKFASEERKGVKGREAFRDFLLRGVQEGMELAEQFPPLRDSNYFVMLLATAGGQIHEEKQLHSTIVAACRQILASSINSNAREMAAFRLIPNLILSSSSRAQTEELFELLEREEMDVERYTHRLDERYITIITAMYNAGKTERLSQLVRQQVHHPLQGDGLDSEIGYRVMEILLAASVGFPLDMVEEMIHQLLLELREEIRDVNPNSSQLPASIGMAALQIGIMRGDLNWGRDMYSELSSAPLPYDADVEYAVFSGDRDRIFSLKEVGSIPSQFQPLLPLLSEGSSTRDHAREEVCRTVLQQEIFSLASLKHIYIAIHLIEVKRENKLLHRLLPDIRLALHKGIEWLIAHNMPGYAGTLIEKAALYFSAKEVKEWKEKYLKTLRTASQKFQLRSLPHRLNTSHCRITMIGKISLQLPGSYPQPVQGTRSQQTLGMLVANSIAEYPLSLSSFRELATGLSADPTGSANYLRVIISRLRSILGREAIITDGQSAPQLNLNIVQVDVIDAFNHLNQCQKDVQTQHPRRAKHSLMSAFRLLTGEVLYPGLYSEIFEAARLDLELRLRDALFATVRLLKAEGEQFEAIDLLRKGNTLMPDDDEIAQELIETLVLCGKHIEALEIRQRIRRIAVES